MTAGAVGAIIGAVAFGLAVAVAVPMFAARGVHHLPIDIVRMWWGATLASLCFGMLGVALGAATRHTVGAIIGAIIWVQVIEVAVLQPSVPSLAKWLADRCRCRVDELRKGRGRVAVARRGCPRPAGVGRRTDLRRRQGQPQQRNRRL